MVTLIVIGQTNCLDRKLHQVLISMARKVATSQITDTFQNEWEIIIFYVAKMWRIAYNIKFTRNVKEKSVLRKFNIEINCSSKQQLADTDHTVRSKCLELIGALGRPDSEEKRSENEKLPQNILDEYSRDTDPRVRTSAFKALVSTVFVLQVSWNKSVFFLIIDEISILQIQWHQRGIQLPEIVYGQVCKALGDEYEGVRLAAVKLVWVLSHLYPETWVSWTWFVSFFLWRKFLLGWCLRVCEAIRNFALYRHVKNEITNLSVGSFSQREHSSYVALFLCCKKKLLSCSVIPGYPLYYIIQNDVTFKIQVVKMCKI